MKPKWLRSLLLTLVVICSSIQVNAQTSSDATPDSQRIKLLEQRISLLQKELIDSQASNAKLQLEIRSLQRQLIDGQYDHPKGDLPSHGDSSRSGNAQSAVGQNCLLLPEINWGSQAATEPISLVGEIGGASLKLTSADEILSAPPMGLATLNLVMHKASKGLGGDTQFIAGKLKLDNGVIILQWNKGDQSACMEALRYALLEVQDGSGKAVQLYHFNKPSAVTLPLAQMASLKIPLTAGIASKVKLSVSKVPGDWKASDLSPTGILELKQDDVAVQIKFDPSVPSVTLSQTGVVRVDDVQRRLVNVTTAYNKAQAELAKYEAQAKAPLRRTESYTEGNLVYQATVEDRSWLDTAIKNKRLQIASLVKTRTALQASLGKNGALNQLSGAAILLSLPNGVPVAEVKLEMPTPAKVESSPGDDQ